MMGKTHLQIGVAASLLMFQHCSYEPLEMGIIAGGILVGNLFPDVDEPKSKMGRKLKIVSYPLRFLNIILGILNFLTFKKVKALNRAYKTTAHRGIFHTVFCVLAAMLIVIAVIKFKLLYYFVAGVTIGMVLHIAADMISEKVALFLPVSEKLYGIAIIPTDSIREKLLRGTIIITNIMLLLSVTGKEEIIYDAIKKMYW